MIHQRPDQLEPKQAVEPVDEAEVSPEQARAIAREVENFQVPHGASLSQSQINKWETCPLQWAFAYRSRVAEPAPKAGALPTPGAIGTAVHSLCEAAGRARVGGLVDQKKKPKAGKRELRTYLKHLSAVWPQLLTTHVDGLIDTIAPLDLSRTIATEVSSIVELEPAADGKKPVTISVVLDRVDRMDENWYELVDYKTGRQRRVSEQEGAPQTAASFLAARAMWPTAHLTMRYDYVCDPTSAPIVIPYQEDLVELGRWRALTVWERMSSDDKPPAHPGDHCVTCPYLERCTQGARYVRNRELPQSMGALIMEGAPALGLLTDEELAGEFLRAKAAEDYAKAARSSFGTMIRERLSTVCRRCSGWKKQRDDDGEIVTCEHCWGTGKDGQWGKWKPRVAHRTLQDYPLDVAEPLSELLGITVILLLKQTGMLNKARTEARCKDNQEALNLLWRWRALDVAQWVEVAESGNPFEG